MSDSLSYISRLDSNFYNLVEHHCEVYMVLHLLHKKSRQKMMFYSIKAPYLICNICLAVANYINKCGLLLPNFFVLLLCKIIDIA